MEGLKIRRLLDKDIDAARSIAQSAWSDLATKDVGRQVQLPPRPRKMLEAYRAVEPHGNFVALKDVELVGASYCHSWGSVGWIGPVEVMPDRQGVGIGTALMQKSQSYLLSKGCKVIGLETIGSSEKHLKFYEALGYRTYGQVLTYEKTLGEEMTRSGETEVVPMGASHSILQAVSTISDRVVAGMDLANEFWMAAECNLGRIIIYRDPHDPGCVLGASIVYGETLEGFPSHLLRTVLVDPMADDRTGIFDALVQDSEVMAKKLGAKRLFFSTPVKAITMAQLTLRGYRTIGSNVRLITGNMPEEHDDHCILSWSG